MKTILRKIPIIIPTILLLLLLISISACKTTSNQVSDEGNNLESGETATVNNPQEQKQEKGYTSEGIKKRGIKRKDDRIAVKKQAEDIPKVTISDETRKQMLRDAKRATKEKRYEDAVKILNAILEARPHDKTALFLKERTKLLVQDRRHNAVMDQLEMLDAQERNKYFENLREKAIPYDDMMKFTTKEKWEDIKKRALREDMSKSKRLDENREHTERLQVAPSSSQNPLSQEMGDALNKKLSIEFIDTPLSDVVVFLQEKTGVNFVLDKNAAATNVSVKLNDVPVSTVLNYILPKGINYVVKDNVVNITLEPLELRVYDVRDLLINLEDRQSLEADASTTEEGGGGKGESRDTFDRVQEIISLITTTIEPASWSVNGGRGRIAAREGMLGDIVVTHVKGIHKQTEDLLAALRSSADLQIAIEARFIAVSDNFLESFGHNIEDFDTSASAPGKFRALNPTPGTDPVTGGVTSGIFSAAGDTFSDTNVSAGATAGKLTELAGATGLNLTYQIFNSFFLKGFLRAVQESEEAETLTAPKITLSNTQRGTIKVVTTTSFISSFTIVSQTPQPVMEDIDSGTTFNVRPIVSADRKYVYLEVHPLITSVTFTETDFQTGGGISSGGGTTDVSVNKIQRPITTKQELSVTVCVPDKGILMIGGLGSRKEKKTSQGVPILSKIPIIKRLFSSNTNARDIAETGNLIIMIKPTILIREEQEAQAFANNKDIEFLNPLK
ncbi:MAG: type II secretion system protein GspD [Candidatus Scalinduaceae bacterium]